MIQGIVCEFEGGVSRKDIMSQVKLALEKGRNKRYNVDEELPEFANQSFWQWELGKDLPKPQTIHIYKVYIRQMLYLLDADVVDKDK